ncbi:MAG: glycosyltransferase family 39 protein, partial [Acidobacteriota bacterium]
MRKANSGAARAKRKKGSPERLLWGIPVLLAVLCFLLYANTLGHSLVFDDVTLILQNRSVLELDWATILYKGGYRPFRTLTYALNYAVGGEDPFGYHLVNVLLHALNAVLAFLLFWRLSRSNAVAGIGAAFMALHPVQTAAVAYVSGRKDLLAAFFLLAGFYLYVSRRKEGGIGWKTLVAVLPLFVLAILSKEVAIVLPV